MGTQKHTHTDIGVTQTDLSTSYFSKVATNCKICGSKYSIA